MENDSSSPFGHGATPSPSVDLSRIPEPALPAEKDGDAQIVDFLPAYQVQRLTAEQKAGLRKSLDANGFLQMVPMICKDYACPMIDKCPLKRLEITRPIGEDCPVESAEVKTWQNRFFGVLPTEERDDPYNVMLVNDVALLQLIEQRAILKMAQDGGDIEQEITVGHTPDGSPLFSKDVHRGIQVYEKISKLKTKLMGKLLQTPQDRVKAAVAGMHDRSTKAAKLMEFMKKLKKEREEARGESEPDVVDAEFSVVNDTPEAHPKPPPPPDGGF
jgi:hypothetical protein